MHIRRISAVSVRLMEVLYGLADHEEKFLDILSVCQAVLYY